MRIRKADQNDLEWLISQLKQFSEFHSSEHKLFGDEEYSNKYISNLINNHVVLIAESNERAGLIAGFITRHPYNPAIKILTETFWWVDVNHRGSSAGARLLNAFKQIGVDLGVDWIQMSLIEGRSPIKEESLIKRGFKLSEKAYLMELGV